MPSAKKQLEKAIYDFVAGVVDEATRTVQAQVEVQIKEAVRRAFNGTVTLPEVINPEPTTKKRGRPRTDKFTKPTCHVMNCGEATRARGYCISHYDKARRDGWPFPAPRNFAPPEKQATKTRQFEVEA